MNSYGTLFKVTLYGESHQHSIGVVIDGVTPGLLIDEKAIKKDLEQRKPGAIGTTTRNETDEFNLTSGVFDGRATGAPIHATIKNKDIVSTDYVDFKKHPRPGHADFVAKVKYQGFNDYRGAGMFSGRLTAPLVIAGSIAKMMLPYKFSHQFIRAGKLVNMEDLDAYLTEIAKKGDSVGGIMEIRVTKVPVGLGEPFFNKLDAEIAKMMFSVPGVKGVEIGAGLLGTEMLGSEFNDCYIDAKGTTKTNNSGGISGGISNGNELIVRVFIKPTPSIKKSQKTFSLTTSKLKELAIKGRHDVCFVRRIGIVLENTLAIVLADQSLLNNIH